MKNLWKYLFILIALVLLWNQVVLLPIKMLSIFFHKIGHALVAFLFGYGSEAFSATFAGTGDTILNTKGWFPSLFIANGGYIGSALFFVLILFLSRTPARKFLLGSLSIIYLVISISYPSLGRSTLIYSIIFTSIVIILYMIGRDGIDEFVIDVIGMSAIAYIIYDTFVATILFRLNQQLTIIKGWVSGIPDDIIRLSNLTNLPDLLWAVVWLAISVFLLNAVVLKAARGRRR